MPKAIAKSITKTASSVLVEAFDESAYLDFMIAARRNPGIMLGSDVT